MMVKVMSMMPIIKTTKQNCTDLYQMMVALFIDLAQ